MKSEIKEPKTRKYPYLAKTIEGFSIICCEAGYMYICNNTYIGRFYKYATCGSYHENELTRLPSGTIVELTQE